MRREHYILDENGEPLVTDLMTWARWVEERPQARVLKRSTVVEGVEVSTVFLGLDHNFSDDGPPILWETMVFGGPLDSEMMRYASREDALLGHEEMCGQVLIQLNTKSE